MKNKTGTCIAVVGAGRMGRGIAITFAYAGYPVSIVDSEQRPQEDFAELSVSVNEEVEAELKFLHETGIISVAQTKQMKKRVDVVSKEESGVTFKKAAFIFEAVSEVVEIKQSTYSWLNSCVSDSAIIASTTSTMLANTLAEFVDKPERFSNAHWLNPAYLMPLIEISPSEKTSNLTVTTLKALFEEIGKVPIVCKASPGYVLSRIQAVALNEAARVVEEGVASAEEVDKAIKVGFGIRYTNLGLLEFIDWGGGDILYYATKYLGDSLDKNRFTTPDIVKQNMENGRNGLRDGIGFYDYKDRDIDAYRNERLTSFVRLLQHLDLMPQAADSED
jgi:3-hydroxybutyryl-CoA dehydrogenase